MVARRPGEAARRVEPADGVAAKRDIVGALARAGVVAIEQRSAEPVDRVDRLAGQNLFHPAPVGVVDEAS